MSSMLSMTEAQLPPGFRFHPRDEELVCDYLANKVRGCNGGIMVDVDLNNCEPWDLPKVACVGGKEWYFFSQRDRKYATGQRTNRATRSGYWKATGKDRQVRRKGTLVGMRKTLVFYQGRAPKGRKTDWVMHEFRMQMQSVQFDIHSLQEDWVLCRVFCKSSRVSGGALSRSSAMESTDSCYDIDANSSSLPPLVDTFIAMEASSGGVKGSIIEQVPCFSGTFPPISACPEDGPAPPFDIPDHIMGGLGPDMGCCYDQDIKLVLKQLSKMDQGSSSRSECRELLADMAPPPGNLESYSDHCLWNNTFSSNYSNNTFDGIQFVYNM